MKHLFWLPAAVLLAVAAVNAAATDAAATDAAAHERGGRPMGPPPEALSACDGRAQGDTLSITLADGRSIAGSCQLMFRPDEPPAR